MVRLTAGIWRGRKLEIPPGIRPTTELARKAAFDILGEAIVGARVLDACAGSGAYGLEALSRGAAHATFVEADRGVAKMLRGNVERLGAGETAPSKRCQWPVFLRRGNRGKRERRGVGLDFDVIFHDPPFEESDPPNPTFSFFFGSCAQVAGCFTSGATTRSFAPRDSSQPTAGAMARRASSFFGPRGLARPAKLRASPQRGFGA